MLSPRSLRNNLVAISVTGNSLKHALAFAYHNDLVANSVMTPFYTEAVAIADRIAVPNSALQTALLDYCGAGKDIRVIDDLLEYKPLTCKAECTQEGPTALWFGHPSNALYLAALINR